MQEMTGDFKIITGHVIPTVMYNAKKQTDCAIAIPANKPTAERKKLKS